MTDREDLAARLDALETAFGFAPTSSVVVTGSGDSGAYPTDVDPDAIVVADRPDDARDPIDTVERIVVPYHRPRAYRGGVVVMSGVDIARVFDEMPSDVREQELEERIERGDPIPPVLQQ